MGLSRMYDLEIKPEADKAFMQISKKDPHLLQIIDKKIRKILIQPFGYKFLRKPLQNLNRVHINKHFVLIFHIDHKEKIVTIISFNHHDEAYKN